MARLTSTDAREILQRIFGNDWEDHGLNYYAQPRRVVEKLIEEARRVKYKAPKNRNGSASRYFYDYLWRLVERGSKRATNPANTTKYARKPLIGTLKGWIIVGLNDRFGNVTYFAGDRFTPTRKFAILYPTTSAGHAQMKMIVDKLPRSVDRIHLAKA